MSETGAMSSSDLDGAILGQAMRKQAKLEKAAAGGSVPFTLVVMLLLSGAILVVGLISVAITESGTEFLPAFMGVIFLLSAMIMRLQMQLKAHRELQKRSDERITRLERKIFADG